MTPVRTPADRLQATARMGIWLSTAVLILLSIFILLFLWTALTDSAAAARELVEQLDLIHPAPQVTASQALLVTCFWLATDVLAFLMLLQTRQLFVGIRARGIFTLITAQRLRRLGWLVFALGPVSVCVNMGVSMVLGHWHDPSELHGAIAIEDADFYAMVIGLVIVAVGHIMVDATRIETEHRAFI